MMGNTYFAFMQFTWSKGHGEYTQTLGQSNYWDNVVFLETETIDSIITKFIGRFFDIRPEEERETRCIFIFKVNNNGCEFVDLIYRIGVDREWWRHSEKPADTTSINWLTLGLPPEFSGIEPLIKAARPRRGER